MILIWRYYSLGAFILGFFKTQNSLNLEGFRRYWCQKKRWTSGFYFTDSLYKLSFRISRSCILLHLQIPAFYFMKEMFSNVEESIGFSQRCSLRQTLDWVHRFLVTWIRSNLEIRLQYAWRILRNFADVPRVGLYTVIYIDSGDLFINILQFAILKGRVGPKSRETWWK